jgi:hypothetical protein
MLNRIVTVQECDTTEADSSHTAKYKNKMRYFLYIGVK